MQSKRLFLFLILFLVLSISPVSAYIMGDMQKSTSLRGFHSGRMGFKDTLLLTRQLPRMQGQMNIMSRNGVNFKSSGGSGLNLCDIPDYVTDINNKGLTQQQLKNSSDRVMAYVKNASKGVYNVKCINKSMDELVPGDIVQIVDKYPNNPDHYIRYLKYCGDEYTTPKHVRMLELHSTNQTYKVQYFKFENVYQNRTIVLNPQMSGEEDYDQVLISIFQNQENELNGTIDSVDSEMGKLRHKYGPCRWLLDNVLKTGWNSLLVGVTGALGGAATVCLAKVGGVAKAKLDGYMFIPDPPAAVPAPVASTSSSVNAGVKGTLVNMPPNPPPAGNFPSRLDAFAASHGLTRCGLNVYMFIGIIALILLIAIITLVITVLVRYYGYYKPQMEKLMKYHIKLENALDNLKQYKTNPDDFWC